LPSRPKTQHIADWDLRRLEKIAAIWHPNTYFASICYRAKPSGSHEGGPTGHRGTEWSDVISVSRDTLAMLITVACTRALSLRRKSGRARLTKIGLYPTPVSRSPLRVSVGGEDVSPDGTRR